MPIYEYFCKRCDVQVELLQSFAADRKIRCPKCNKWIKRIISRLGGFVLKGPGFYANDYEGR